MPIYIRFEHNKQVETTTLESKPIGNDWYEAPKNFDWQKSYQLTEGGEIAQRSQEDIELELLQNAKFSALSNLRAYYDNYTNEYAGNSHQKAKSYQIQEKAAKSILAAPESIDEKDKEIIEPLAKVRGITVIEMARIIEEKAKKAVKEIIKCEELEDITKKKIAEAKSKNELENLYQIPLLGVQIGDIAELFNCGVGKRSNKFAQSALKQSNCIVYLIAQNVLFYI